jgi:hypothetical protein
MEMDIPFAKFYNDLFLFTLFFFFAAVYFNSFQGQYFGQSNLRKGNINFGPFFSKKEKEKSVMPVIT